MSTSGTTIVTCQYSSLWTTVRAARGKKCMGSVSQLAASRREHIDPVIDETCESMTRNRNIGLWFEVRQRESGLRVRSKVCFEAADSRISDCDEIKPTLLHLSSRLHVAPFAQLKPPSHPCV